MVFFGLAHFKDTKKTALTPTTKKNETLEKNSADGR